MGKAGRCKKTGGRARRWRATAMVAAGVGLIAGITAERRCRRAFHGWGATPMERVEPLPGDDVIADAGLQGTMAISIAAPPTTVWPWLVQMGQDRGGLYSSLLVENGLLRLGFTNADRIHPEWQNLRVGDRIWLMPERYPGPRSGPRVLAIAPERSLVLGFQVGEEGINHGSWAFVLRPEDGGARLILRSRYPRAGALRFNRALAGGYFVMQRAMLRGIRSRAEITAAVAGAEPALIERILPDAQFRGRAATTVDAPPAAVMRALRDVTLTDMPIARLLGEMRYLPGRLLRRQPARADVRQPFIEQVLAGGNLILGERPGRELVIGMAGRLHNLLDQQPVHFSSPADFAAFADPDYEQFVQSFRAEPLPGGGSWLVAEHRTRALGPAARRKFALYWLAIRPAGNLALRLLLDAVRRRAERMPPARAVAPAQPDAGAGNAVVAATAPLPAALAARR